VLINKRQTHNKNIAASGAGRGNISTLHRCTLVRA